ncbi:MAG: hypothetical protein WA705_06010 [Candidatus Ozemobacteraceae bacterium]
MVKVASVADFIKDGEKNEKKSAGKRKKISREKENCLAGNSTIAGPKFQ